MCGVVVTQGGGLGGLALGYCLPAPVGAPEVAAGPVLLGELGARKGIQQAGFYPPALRARRPAPTAEASLEVPTAPPSRRVPQTVVPPSYHRPTTVLPPSYHRHNTVAPPQWQEGGKRPPRTDRTNR